MGSFRRLARATYSARPKLMEVVGLSLVTAGVHEAYPPAAFIFAGVALVFIAQGMERGR